MISFLTLSAVSSLGGGEFFLGGDSIRSSSPVIPRHFLEGFQGKKRGGHLAICEKFEIPFRNKATLPVREKNFPFRRKHSRLRKSSLMTTSAFCGRLYIHSFFCTFPSFRFRWNSEDIRSCAGRIFVWGARLKKRGEGMS